MTREIDIPEYQYNNIMAFDSVNLGRVPYKGIIMYAINAIKRSKALEQTKNDLGVDAISRADVLKLMQDNWHTHNGDWAMQESMDDIRVLPSVTPQEPQTYKWCTDCREYDQEKHCCYRWTKVIRNTVEEMKQEYIEREVLDKIRAEIKGMTPTYHNPDWSITDLVPISEVLKRVDKYKAETEAEDGNDN